MKSILFIQPINITFSGSGKSRFLYLSRELEKMGCNSWIIGLNSDLSAEWTNVLSITTPEKANFLKRQFIYAQLVCLSVSIIFKKKPDVIYFRHPFLFPAAIVGKLIGIKIFFEFHGFRYLEQEKEGRHNRLKIVLTKCMEKISLSLSDSIITISSGISGGLDEKISKKCLILPNSIDISLFEKEYTPEEIEDVRNRYNLSYDMRITGFVASGGEHLAIEDLINYQEFVHDIHSLIICDLEMSPQLPKLAKKYPLVILTGLIPHQDVIILLKYFVDICILPYNKDWYGSNIKNFFSSRKSSEYVAAGKPIIVSKIDGVPIFLTENINYISYESKNTQDLAEKILLLYQNNSLYRQLSQNNQALATTLTWEYNIKKSGIVRLLDGKKHS